MSDKVKVTQEQLEQMMKIENICKSASELCAFTMFHMQTGEFGVAVSEDEIAVGFFERLKELYKHLSGDEEADGKFELQYVSAGDDEDDGASGGSEADTREAGGVVRPSNRKLH